MKLFGKYKKFEPVFEIE